MNQPLFVLIAILAGLGSSLAIGFVNGMIIGVAGVSAILCTLGTMTFVGGVNILITRGYTISGAPEALIFIGNTAIMGIPIPLIVFALCAFIVSIIMNRTILGYGIYMIGSNMVATHFSGLNNKRLIIRTYIMSSLLGAVSSFVMLGRFNSASADYGNYYLLITVLAAVLGGTSATGGFGKVSGPVISIVILQGIASGLNLFKVDPYLAPVLWGLIMILVMSINFFLGKHKSG